MVAELVRHGDPVEVDGLARRVFDAETHGPTRPHPRTPHTGFPGLVARRIWALADRFWDAAEGRVIPDPVRPAPHRHDSLTRSTSSPTRSSTPTPRSWSTITSTTGTTGTAGRPGSAALARQVNDGLRPRPA